MILTLTLNPFVDILYPLTALKLDDVNRAQEVSKIAGGKGLNVTRVLVQVGEPVLVSGFTSGELDQFIAKKLDHAGIKHVFYNIKGETRNCIAILHEGQQTEILEQGPETDNQEAAGFTRHFEQLLEKVEVVTISGSLLKGSDQDYYVQIIE